MKKIAILIISSLILVGCQSIQQDLPDRYKDNGVIDEAISYGVSTSDSTYFNKENIQFKNEVYRAAYEITYDWNQYMEIIENNIYNMYFMLTIWDVDSEVGQAVIHKLQDFIGIEVINFINEMKGKSKAESNVEHRIINDYSVTCNNQYGKVSIRVIQLNRESMKEKSVRESQEKLLTNQFLVGSFYKGEEHQLIGAITPMLIRNEYIDRDERTNGARYQIFKTNTGEIEKLRVILYDYGKEDSHKSYEELWNKIAQAAEMNEPAERKVFIQKIDEVLNHQKDKGKGNSSKSKYKITRYAEENYSEEELVEILVEMNR